MSTASSDEEGMINPSQVVKAQLRIDAPSMQDSSYEEEEVETAVAEVSEFEKRKQRLACQLEEAMEAAAEEGLRVEEGDGERGMENEWEEEGEGGGGGGWVDRGGGARLVCQLEAAMEAAAEEVVGGATGEEAGEGEGGREREEEEEGECHEPEASQARHQENEGAGEGGENEGPGEGERENEGEGEGERENEEEGEGASELEPETSQALDEPEDSKPDLEASQAMHEARGPASPTSPFQQQGLDQIQQVPESCTTER